MSFPPSISYWELKNWFTDIDFLIVGSGIVGLNAALQLKSKYPNSKVLVLEKGFLPSGASTKNAGFACFGSISEILEDLQVHSSKEVLQLVQKRFEGIQLLRKYLGDSAIGYKNFGGYEYFETTDAEGFEACKERLNSINGLLKPVFGRSPFEETPLQFGLKNFLPVGFFNPFESQIDTGNMMQHLAQKAIKKGILLLNGLEVSAIQTASEQVHLQLNQAIDIKAKNVLVATNGFAARLLDVDVVPARAQVLITQPIKGLRLKGTFHLDKGYYYFRNVGQRVLLGGGRNLNFSGEQTSEIALTQQIQNRLDELLKNAILPDTTFEVAHRWAGIMGVGRQKRPIVKKISHRLACAVRMGGMGVALGSATGKELAELF